MKTADKKHSGLLIGLIALVLVIAVVSLIGWIVLKPDPIVLQGQAEATEVRVSGKVPGRIETFRVSEGMQVKQGDTLVFLSSPELNAKLFQATSAEDAAAAQDMKARKGARAEQIAGAYELWQKAEVGVQLADRPLRGYRTCSTKVWFLPRSGMKQKLPGRPQLQQPRLPNRSTTWL